MRCTSSRSVGASLIAIGLANVKKKFLVVSAPGVWRSWPLGLPQLTLHEKVTQPELPEGVRRGCQNHPHAAVSA